MQRRETCSIRSHFTLFRMLGFFRLSSRHWCSLLYIRTAVGIDTDNTSIIHSIAYFLLCCAKEETLVALLGHHANGHQAKEKASKDSKENGPSGQSATPRLFVVLRDTVRHITNLFNIFRSQVFHDTQFLCSEMSVRVNGCCNGLFRACCEAYLSLCAQSSVHGLCRLFQSCCHVRDFSFQLFSLSLL